MWFCRWWAAQTGIVPAAARVSAVTYRGTMSTIRENPTNIPNGSEEGEYPQSLCDKQGVWWVRQRGGRPVAFTVAVTDVVGPLKATTFPVLAGSVSIEVDASSTGAVSLGGSGVTSADLANDIGSREDGMLYADLADVYAVCATGLTATLKVRAVVP